MKATQIVTYLRNNVHIQDPSGSTTDPVYLSMTDADVLLLIQVACCRDYPAYAGMSSIPDDSVYPVMLLAKKELYFKLATDSAPLYPIKSGSDELQKNIRFDHYIALVKETDKEYQEWTDSSVVLGSTYGTGSVTVTLANKYYSSTNYNTQPLPQVMVSVDSVTSSEADISWSVRKVECFYNYLVYLSNAQIIDVYNEDEKSYRQFKIADSAQKKMEILNIRDSHARLSGLSSNTGYNVCVIVQERNGLKGYQEVQFSTLV